MEDFQVKLALNSIILITILFCGSYYNCYGQDPDTVSALSYTANEYFAMGKAFYKEKRYEEALDAFMQALNINPKHKSARDYLEKTANTIENPGKIKNKKILKELEFEDTYSKAIADYKKGYYLKATEGLLKTPKYKRTTSYLKKINRKMEEIATDITSPEMEKIAYANGYRAYFSSDVQKSINEWEKVMSFNPNNIEVAEYLEKTRKYIHEQEIEKELSELYESGEDNFQKEKYPEAISRWENVLEVSKKENISSSYVWQEKANKRIEVALERLQNIVQKRSSAPAASKKEEVSPKAETNTGDMKKAEEYYTQGLVAYANGRIRDAIRIWDMTLRLNPEHERARKSKETALAELKE